MKTVTGKEKGKVLEVLNEEGIFTLGHLMVLGGNSHVVKQCLGARLEERKNTSRPCEIPNTSKKVN